MAMMIRYVVLAGLAVSLMAGCARTADRVAPPPPVIADTPPPPAPMPSPEPAPPPPPPPPAAMDSAGSGSSAIVTTGARSTTRRGDPMKVEGEAAMPGLVPPRRPPPPRQAGLLTAGDHDDLLNPQLYTRYAARYLQNNAQPNLPLLDAAQRIRIVVRDAAGKPAPFVRVAVRRVNAPPLVLSTAADGAISVFPALDGLPARLELTVTPPGGQAFTRMATPVDRVVAVDLPGRAARVDKVDLLLTIDTTGSMSDELSYLQTELRAIVARLKERNANLDLRIGLIVYRDIGDEYVTRPFAFTRDVPALQAALAAQRADGGGDYPEAVDRALVESVERFDWRVDAVKAMLFVADAPPHANKMAASWTAAMAARARGIHIVPVGASGVAADAEYLMRSMAAVTQSRYLFLTDDSGIGLPHQDPDVPCYLVTRLDNLVGRVLAGLIAGQRIEPQDNDIIRTVGDYGKGVCLASRRPRPAPFPRPPRPLPRPY